MPDLMVMLDELPYSWDIVEEASRAVDEWEQALRSGAMEDVVAYGFGHRLLTEADIPALRESRESK